MSARLKCLTRIGDCQYSFGSSSHNPIFWRTDVFEFKSLMLKIPIVFLCIVAVPVVAIADPHEDSAQKLASYVMNEGKQYDLVVDIFSQILSYQFRPIVELQRGKPLTREELTTFRGALKEMAIEVVPMELWVKDLAKSYKRLFSKSELDEILAFYKTPTGLKLLHNQKTLTNELNRTGERLSKEKSAELSSRLGAVMNF